MTRALTRAPQTASTAVLPDAPAAAPASVDELVRSHLPLARHLAREVASRVPAHVDLGELESAAFYALAASAKNYNADFGASFTNFAAIRIRGALTDELRAMDWASRTARSRARQVQEARRELTERLQRTPSSREVAAELGMDHGAVSAAEADARRANVQSLHALTAAGDFDVAADQAGPEALLVGRHEREALHAGIAALPERLRFVVIEYFFKQRRMAEVAADLGVSESRVSQLRGEALVALRRHLDTAA